MSLKDAIVAATKPRIVKTELKVGEETLQLRFRALKYPERRSIFQDKIKEVGKDSEGRPIMQIPAKLTADINAEFLAISLIDDDDSPVATKEEIIKNWDAVIADKIADAGLKALGMTGDTKEDEANPSEPKSESGGA